MDSLRSNPYVYREVTQNEPSQVEESPFSGTNDDDRSNPLGEAPKLAASRFGNRFWMRELLEENPQQVNPLLLSGESTTSCKKYTRPLCLAAQNGHVDVLNLLFEAAKKLPETTEVIREMLTATTCEGASPVFIAAQNGHVDVLNLLFEAAEKLPETTEVIREMLTVPCDGVSPAYIAARNGNHDVLTAMFDTARTLPEADKKAVIREMQTATRKGKTTYREPPGQKKLQSMSIVASSTHSNPVYTGGNRGDLEANKNGSSVRDGESRLDQCVRWAKRNKAKVVVGSLLFLGVTSGAVSLPLLLTGGGVVSGKYLLDKNITPSPPPCGDVDVDVDVRCPLILDPVCGSTGESFANLCMLKVISCLYEPDLVFVSSGECPEVIIDVSTPYAQKTSRHA